MRATAALSAHPLATHAVGEVAGAVLDDLGPDAPIDLLVVFVEGGHTGTLEDIYTALSDLLSPNHSIGVSACGVLANDTEVENQPSLSVWAASGLDAHPVRIEAGAASPTAGWPTDSRHMIVLADPFSVPLDELIDDAALVVPALAIHGGLASSANAPGGNRLLLDGALYNDGAVGISVEGVEITSVVSQGCRPIGNPLTVTGTGAETGRGAHIITELASKPPLSVLREIAAEANDEDKALLASGVHIGIVIDEGLHDHATGDFLIRGVMGGDNQSGAIAIGARVEVGTTVQFHVRDATTATEDLQRVLQGCSAQAALAFTCNGRGKRLFGFSGHDAQMIHEHVGANATAGMFCAGELGPVGKRNQVHGFTASVMLFHT